MIYKKINEFVPEGPKTIKCRILSYIWGKCTHLACQFDVCTMYIQALSFIFSEIWLIFFKMIPKWKHKLPLRDIVWGHHTNSLISFVVNLPKKMVATTNALLYWKLWTCHAYVKYNSKTLYCTIFYCLHSLATRGILLIFWHFLVPDGQNMQYRIS